MVDYTQEGQGCKDLSGAEDVKLYRMFQGKADGEGHVVGH